MRHYLLVAADRSKVVAPDDSSVAPGIRGRWRRWCEPAVSGLPNWRVVTAVPALLTGLLILLVGAGISGSSTGVLRQLFVSGDDSDLLAGTPRAVRSDEWLTHGMWVAAQSAQGFPRINGVFPGGSDSTILLDLPAWDFATIFRPQAIGFMLFGLDRGLALQWWLPAFAVIAAGYLLLVTFLPRRPLTSAAVATAFYLCPLLQWWVLPQAHWPAAWCLAGITAVLWSLRDPRRWVRRTWAGVAGYIAACAALTMYPAFFLPATLVAVAIAAGALLGEGGAEGIGIRTALVRMIPLGTALVAAIAAVGLFAVTRWPVIDAILHTEYPGQRLQPTGGMGWSELGQLFAAPFELGLQHGDRYAGLLGTNASEAAGPLLIGIFLAVPLGRLVARDRCGSGSARAIVIAWLCVTALLFAFLLIPGWDPLAHLLLLDRTIVNRSRIGTGLLSIIAIALLAGILDRTGQRVPRSVSLTTAGLAAGTLGAVWLWLESADDPSLVGWPPQLAIAASFVAGVWWYCRGRPAAASAALLAVSIAVGAGVNPLYRGYTDLAELELGQQITRIDSARPGTWVALSSVEMSAFLVESGVRAYNGVQTYPVPDMWQDIDPTGASKQQWNRYASLVWETGHGEPVLRNPQPDVVLMTFDSCSTFGQQHVTYVLADHPVDQPCLVPLTEGMQGPWPYRIYQVTDR